MKALTFLLIAITITGMLTGCIQLGKAQTVTATIPFGRAPIGVAVTPDGTYVYIANKYSHEYNNSYNTWF
jgi:DNA-binding beta-propeller fold protein YncE